MCVGSALVLATLALLLGSDLNRSHRLIISDCGLIAGGVATAISCGIRAHFSVGRRRRAWRFYVAAGISAALGNIWVLAVHLASGSAQLVLVSAPAFYIALALGVVGMAAFPAMPRRGTDLARMILDAAIIGLALFTIASIAIFPSLKNGPGGSLPLAVADVTVAAVAVLLFLRVGANDRPALAFIAAGCILYAVTDLVSAWYTARDGQFWYGSPIDLGWMAGYVLIALSAQHPATVAVVPAEEPREASPAAGTLLVFGLLTAAAASSMSGAVKQTFDATQAALWLVMLLAVAGRQVLLIADNDKLRHGLELRVDERTNELRDATRRSELLLSSVGEGIYGVDLGGFITFVNPAGAGTLGFSPRELIGKQAHHTFHALQEDGSAYPVESCYVTEAIRDGTVTLAEEDLYTRANGRRFAVEVTATPLARDNVVQGAVVVFRDITQRLEVDRLKSEFVSMVSHELRTPLTSIRGSLGLLAGGALGQLPVPAVRLVGVALDSCNRLTRLINDILDVERIESGTMPMIISDHRSADLINAAMAQLQLIASQVEVLIVVTRTEGVVTADADRVVQTLINLVDNAIKFSPPQTTVEVSATARDEMIEFCIRDQGRGIPADKIDSIFRRFEQVDSSDAREKGGSGLGLAISRSVVEKLGGRIWAEGNEGPGATFRFTLPAAAAASMPEPEPDSASTHAPDPTAVSDPALFPDKAAAGLP